MPPVSITLPSELLTFFAIVAMLWIFASILDVGMIMGMVLRYSRNFQSRAEAQTVERQFDFTRILQARHADLRAFRRQSNHCA